MNIADLLILATARNVNFDYIPGGKPNITMEDVMYALATVKHGGAELLLRVKYTHDTTFLSDLERKLLMAIADLESVQQRTIPKERQGQEFLRNLGRLALFEQLSPHICMSCGGVGKRLCTADMLKAMNKHNIAVNEGKILECTTCRGTGRKRPTEHSRAQTMTIPWETWRRTWSGCYMDVQAILIDWEDIGIRKATHRLRA